MGTLEKAIQIATEAHKGQFDKSGKEYIQHPLRVMEMGKSEQEKVVGVLHDVVEDTDWTFERLTAEGFSEEIIAGILCSSCAPKETYTVVISLDAFRSDYLKLFETSGLDKIAEDGMSCVLEPSYPTSTSIRNIDIYSLLADILGINPVKTDGTMPNF